VQHDGGAAGVRDRLRSEKGKMVNFVKSYSYSAKRYSYAYSSFIFEYEYAYEYEYENRFEA
jgi:hypothetical protein